MARLSEDEMIEVLKHVDFYAETTVHGLRSTFSSWANEHGHRKDVIEAAISHQEEDRVRRIYHDAPLTSSTRPHDPRRRSP